MQKLTVRVYSPPRIEFPPDVRGILVSSRFVPAEGEYEAVQWGYFNSVDSALWDLSKYYAEAYSAALDSTERFISKTDFDLRMLRNNNDTIPEPLPWAGLIAITDKFNASGIAILEGFAIEESDPVVKEEKVGESQGFVVLKNINVKAAWRICQPERRRMLDENIYSFDKEFKGEGKTAEEAINSLPSNDEMFKSACVWAARQYALMIIPGEDLVERDYYKEGHVKLVEAHEAIQKGEWGRAESKWNYLSYMGEDDEIKAMGCYNMALLCERDGRLNQALGFARKANIFVPHRRHINLINELTIKVFQEEEKRERGEVIRNW